MRFRGSGCTLLQGLSDPILDRAHIFLRPSFIS
jgi:hypothetical protein